MKGRFRKGKKAFAKAGVLSPPQAKLKARYAAYLEYRRKQAILASKIALASFATVLGAMRIAAIQSKSMPKFENGSASIEGEITKAEEWRKEKAMSIAETVMETALSVCKALQFNG